MSAKKPIIGVTPWYDYDKGITYIKKGYLEAILECGGIPALLPFYKEEQLENIIKAFDGFLLSGGSDFDAKIFGEDNLPCNGRICPLRDKLEIGLIKSAVRYYKPILGICRGMQAINIAMGGSVYQDIYSQAAGKKLIMHMQNAPGWYPIHELQISCDSLIYDILKTTCLNVNSFHHQAVKILPDGLKASAFTSDGITECIELSERPFTVGVQWHPELMWDKNKIHKKLFYAFVEACAV